MNRQIELLYNYLLKRDGKVVRQEPTEDGGIQITVGIDGIAIYIHIYSNSACNYSSFFKGRGGFYD